LRASRHYIREFLGRASDAPGQHELRIPRLGPAHSSSQLWDEDAADSRPPLGRRGYRRLGERGSEPVHQLVKDRDLQYLLAEAFREALAPVQSFQDVTSARESDRLCGLL